MINPAREVYAFIPGWVILGLMLIGSVGLFVIVTYKRWCLLWLGKPENRFDKIGERIKSVLFFTFIHRRVLDKPLSGILHFMIFCGFLVFTFGYIFIFGNGFIPGFTMNNILGEGFTNFYLNFQNLFGALVIIGVLMAFFQRYILKPKRLENTLSSTIILFLILFIMLTYFISDSIGQLLPPVVTSTLPNAAPAGGPFSQWLAGVFKDSGWSIGSLNAIFHLTWWIHLALILSFLIYIPYTKHLHLILCPVNEFFRCLSPKGAMKFIDLEKAETFGVAKVTEYTWKDILDFYTCTECGRCSEVCPAKETQKPLDPKKIICKLRDHTSENIDLILKQSSAANPKGWSSRLLGVMSKIARPTATNPESPKDLNFIGPTISEDEIWACTTCGNCKSACPVFIEQPDKIMEMRRNLVLSESKFPSEVVTVFKNLETNGNPWPVSWDKRSDWCKDLNVRILQEGEKAEVLLWVGCAGATDDRNIKVARSLVTILQKTGVDFAILGNAERCCGDSARRIGNEYLYQQLAQDNVQILKKRSFSNILTYCPHCFNTLKNEYRQVGGEFNVIHHTEFIWELIQSGKLSPSQIPHFKAPIPITYHDSCYLGRYNDIYDAPRRILKSIPGLKFREMSRHHQQSFCCGAGGGRMWMEEKLGTRINQTRVQEAVYAAQNGLVITACPYCLTMLGDGIKERGITATLKAQDIAEILS